MEENPHHNPSRRSFLKSGFVSGILLANPFGMLGNLFPKSAFAAEPASVPFFVFDLVGGAGLPSSFVPLGKDYKYLADYRSVNGLNPSAGGSVDTRFGTPMFVGKEYQVHAALLSVCSKEALERTRFITICHQSLSDKSNNTLSAVQLVSDIAKSKVFKSGLGTSDTLSGGYSEAVAQKNQGKPLLIRSVKDIISQVKPTGPLAALSDNEIKNLGNAGTELADLQTKKLFSKGDSLADSVTQAYRDNAQKMQERVRVDPNDSEEARRVYGNAVSSVNAGIAFNVLNGNASVGVFRLDDFDYHAPKTREQVLEIDAGFGRALAQTIELSHQMKKPMFAQIITDGGCSAGAPYWGGDDNSKSMTVLACYHPDGARDMLSEQHQIGHYFFNKRESSVGAETATFMGNSAESAALISFANYLAFSGRIGELEKAIAYMNDSAKVTEIKKHVLFKL